MKLPFSFSPKLVFRLLLPGLLVSLGAWPITDQLRTHLPVSVTPLVALGFSVLLFGWIFVLLDEPIYRLLQGRRYWPAWLHARFREREEERLQRELARANDEDLPDHLQREAAVEVRRFPLEPGTGYCVRQPTRLGNLIAAFELHPKRVYGMEGVFYWPRLMIGLDEDLRQEIDERQALADSAVYGCVALAANAGLCLLFALLRFAAGSTQPPFVPAAEAWVLLLGAVLCGAGSVVVYRIALHAQAGFGELFMAVFDRFQHELDVEPILAEIRALDPGAVPDDLSARARNTIAWRYLRNGRIRRASGELAYPWTGLPGYRDPAKEPERPKPSSPPPLTVTRLVRRYVRRPGSADGP